MIKKIPVTKSFIPPISEYSLILKEAFQNGWLTNRGVLTIKLEDELKAYLSVKNILLTTNGTLPLQIAIKALNLKGEIITTPFSYIATSSAILWENCKPIYVDIDPDYLCIDENKIEERINNDTSCIIATHVFGNPCNIDKISSISEKYNIPVIYDAAHCFGVNYNGKSIFNYGSITTCSFHATKLFHTGEGGALFCSDDRVFHKAFYSHNFGHDGKEKYFGLGINAKISELQSAMGLTVLPYFNKIKAKRKLIVNLYNSILNLSEIKTIKIRENTDLNFSYYPVIFKSEEVLKNVINNLNSNNIFPRRYFYPSLNTIPYINGPSMPISESISSRILCLPLYDSLDLEDVKKICKIINGSV